MGFTHALTHLQYLFSINWGAASGWWLPACVALGVGYAWLMYRHLKGVPKTVVIVLFVLRAFLVTLLALLLVSPLVKTVTYKPQKPLILIAADNTQSIQLFGSKPDHDLQRRLSSLKKQLGDGYEVHGFHFDSSLHDSLSNGYGGKQTNIANALKQLNEQFVNQNVGAVILATDGIYNVGADPISQAGAIKSSIYTVALGDTVPRRDLLVGNINYNKTAFLGNDFEVEVLAEAYQSSGERLRIAIIEDGRPVAAQTATVTSSSFRKIFTFKLNADTKGTHKFTVNITPVANELSTQNNTETFYVDVLDARQKILLLANGPHPDLAAIKSSVESNRNFEVKTVLPDELANIKLSEYSLVILYQPSATAVEKVQQMLKSGVPILFVVGTQTDISVFNNIQTSLRINTTREDDQEVFAQPVSAFTLFTLSDSTVNKIAKMPPLLSPYGSFETKGNLVPLLKQRIGSLVTGYPLLSFSDEGSRRTGVLTGEGIWRWQLAEYREYANHHATEELFSQTVQYLTANGKRERFRVYPGKTVFDEGENILLNAELYNDALQLVNTPDVSVVLKNSEGRSFNFLFSRGGQSYQLNAGALPPGEYSYSASTQNGSQRFAANGHFAIKQLNLEARQSAANHGLLRIMAKRSGGEMVYPADIGRLAELIRRNENIKTVVYEDKRYEDLIDIKWLFVIIIALLTTEWLVRKREGQV